MYSVKFLLVPSKKAIKNRDEIIPEKSEYLLFFGRRANRANASARAAADALVFFDFIFAIALMNGFHGALGRTGSRRKCTHQKSCMP